MIAGVGGLALGSLLSGLGVCPVVKRIWTPSWVLFSGGACSLLLAGFYALVDVAPRGRGMFPLVVIGTNSIAAYLIAHLLVDFIRQGLLTHIGPAFFRTAPSGGDDAFGDVGFVVRDVSKKMVFADLAPAELSCDRVGLANR